MSGLCDGCLHRRAPDTNLLDRPSARGLSASVQRELNRQRGEFEARLRIKDLVYQHPEGKGGTTLNGRPIKYAWCAAKLQPDAGTFYFCDWLKPDAACDSYAPTAPKTKATTTRASAVRHDAPSREPAPATAPAPAPATTPRSWTLLGEAYDLEAASRALPGGALGTGSFEIDYQHVRHWLNISCGYFGGSVEWL